jgi:murein DD-endopeptidase MepM/ murein hydrolase activator NlpD
VPPNAPNGSYTFTSEQDYGPRDNPDYPYHYGLDFGRAAGTTILAIDGGTVIEHGISATNGYVVKLQHAGYQSRYSHMLAGSTTHLSLGQWLARGSGVGKVGATGSAARGNHLHLDVIVNGQRIDPEAFIYANLNTQDPQRGASDGMSTVYYRTTDYLYALAGDSPGTSANWIESSNPAVYNKWVVARNLGNGPLDAATFEAWKQRYLEPIQMISVTA